MGPSKLHHDPFPASNGQVRRGGHTLEFLGRIAVARRGFPLLLRREALLQLAVTAVGPGARMVRRGGGIWIRSRDIQTEEIAALDQPVNTEGNGL